MSNGFYRHLAEQLEQVKAEGLYKQERIITSAQQAQIAVGGEQVLNFCANNYLGLANHPDLIAAAHQGLDSHGFGMASVRFICGTQDQHKALEQKLSAFLGTEDTILYSSCFDANGGLFETLFGAEDAIISDALNHASIIDGVRLCKAKRYRYANNDMAELEAQLKQADADGARFKLSSPVFTPSPDKTGNKFDPAKPYYKGPLFTADVLGHTTIVDLMTKLLDSDQPDAIGIAFGSPRDLQADLGFEFRLSRISDSVGYASAVADAYSIYNVRLDVKPIKIQQPFYQYK